MKRREILTALVPLVTLIGLVVLAVFVFGRDVGDGASQISILLATAVAALLARTVLGTPWSVLEQGIVKGVSSVTVSVFILLLIGMLSGTWMISGTVPTLISYGVRLIRPDCFLVTATVVCALVALVTGTSWSTVATVGVALAVIALAVALSRLQGANDLFDMTNRVFAVFLPPTAIPMILGICSRRLSRRSGMFGLVGGTAVGFLVFFASFAWPCLRQTVVMFPVTSFATLLCLWLGTRLRSDSAEECGAMQTFFNRVDGEGSAV